MRPRHAQYYLRARFYNPVIARFTQEDEYRGDSLNLYAYVGNNPIKYVDPSGSSSQNIGCGGGGKKEGPYAGTGEAEWLVGKNGKVNWKSRPNFGHTFETHGAGNKNLESLKGRARTVNELGKMTEQGQWLDNQKAAEFLNSYGKVDKPTIVDIPEGLGQVITPSWDIIPSTKAVIIPISKTGKLITSYPCK
ncbi:RHS repeat-associated core domain-containing protein [Paenibacillus dendritiformis]|uniref:RHS repeat-associated core domain-containing protein n=1 Tax=Paenibacillus dendritiformis TaxID=130049 RepID=UPI00197E8AAB